MSTSYEVLARKYRPQQFDDVVGQRHVTDTLKNAIASKRVAHAYLFVGPRGVGKTTIARIFAKALNCEKGTNTEPCDRCDSCREVREGRNLDVLEIDGASNNGVDQVRELRDNVVYAPARGPYKVYIIDEVHMLSTAAFNALLKTLEEPPPHIKFLLATTDPQKVLPTVVSRCQRFDLRRIATREIVDHLLMIAGKEGIGLDADAALAIARGAEGGLRDAESALDQLIAFRGKTITEPDVLSVFGLVARKTLDALALAVVKGDVAAVLRNVAELDASGKDLQRLTSELLDYFRNVLVFTHAGNELPGQDMAESQVEALKAVQGQIDPSRLMPVVDLLVELQGRIRDALTRRTLLELYLIRAAHAARTVSLDEVLRRVQELRAAAGGPVAAPPRPAPTAPPAAPQAPPAALVPAAPSAPEPPAGNELERLTSGWHALVERVGQLALVAKSYLMDAKPVSVSQDKVVIGFDPEFASKRESMDHPRNVQAVQRALEEVLKRKVAVAFTILGAAQAGALPSDKPAAPKAGTRAAPSEPGPGRKSRQQWTEDPAVKRALETFNGDIIDIRE